MNIFESRAMLCGFFTVRKTRKNGTDAADILNGWKETVYSGEEIDEMKDFYYSDFIDFITGNGNGDVRTFVKSVEKDLEMHDGDSVHKFSVKDIRLHFFPFNIVIFSIKVVQKDTAFSNVTSVLNRLRNICYYSPDRMSGFIKTAIEPICEVYSRLTGDYRTTERISYDGSATIGYPFLVENGNKLKLFHILATEEYRNSPEKTDCLLYDAGTLTREGSFNGNDFMSSSKDYFESVMSSNRLSVFNNWKALALFDTFTIFSGSVRDYLLANWETDYFGKIYLYCLFRKFYLFRLNTVFRKSGSNLHRLRDEFITFERRYCFPRISYNFLPLEIMAHLDRSLDISMDKDEMENMLKQESETREASADKRMNSLLFFLTCLTTFSAVWDFGCLLDSMYPFELSVGSSITGFRVVTYVLLLVTLLFAIVNRTVKR